MNDNSFLYINLIKVQIVWLFEKRELHFSFLDRRSKILQEDTFFILQLNTFITKLVSPGPKEKNNGKNNHLMCAVKPN